ncbi:hypothetical protein J2S55_008093 [Streptosporangium brasiliense]|uniref:Uncharacterized protein n=1 Tax=Streptosporangium brasiliense TaxID=47480 RepID=A0ABT9RHR2_9ACTN|nr:hypothetical protein [Streptosporangium brasiliense]MDP9868827.1 hypothetical protein [Streptosporangium brasiliense]
MVHGKAPMGTHPRPIDSATGTRATGHHEGSMASLKLGQTLAPGGTSSILTVLKRSVVLWVKESTGR